MGIWPEIEPDESRRLLAVCDKLASFPFFLTVEEVAELIRVSPQTVRRMIEKGQIPGYQVGDRVFRIKRDELMETMEEWRVRINDPENEGEG